MEQRKYSFLPFILSGVLILADQLTKAMVVAFIPPGTIGLGSFGDLLNIIHVRNTGIAFSIGQDAPDFVRIGVFVILPLAVMVFLAFYLVRGKDLSVYQRWILAGIVGGGLGNLIDRIFRPEGVVDFLSVRFYGFLGMERFPTFNVADSSVVVCGILLFLSIFFQKRRVTA